MNVPVARIFELLGHDGTEQIYPDLDTPQCYRGFHITELIWVAYRLGYYVLEIPEELGMVRNGVVVPIKLPYTHEHMMRMHSCVITTSNHAVAWSAEDEKIYDPNGTIYDYPINDAQEFYFVIMINGEKVTFL
jgi:hypothetical protein